MSGLQLVGEMEISALCPIVLAGITAAEAALNAQVTGLLAASVQLNVNPGSLTGSITIVTALLAQLEAALELAIVWPSASLQISAIAALVAELEVELQILVGLVGILATAGVFVYTWEGPVNALGPAISAQFATGWPDGTKAFDKSWAILLGATTEGTWIGMQSFFGGAFGA